MRMMRWIPLLLLCSIVLNRWSLVLVLLSAAPAFTACTADGSPSGDGSSSGGGDGPSSGVGDGPSTGVGDGPSSGVGDGSSSGDGDGDGELTWTGGIAEIFEANCVRCHASGHFSTYAPLQTYDQVVERTANIRQKIQFPPGWGTQMPPYPGGESPGVCEPAHPYSNDLRMDPDEIEAILSWIELGAPFGTGTPPAEPLVAVPPQTLPDATEYPHREGYLMTIGDDDDDGHRDDWVCVIVDPGTIAGNRYLSAMAITPGQTQVFRGAVVQLDPARESLAYVADDSPRDHGATWYDCDEGFGFEGQILGAFLPQGEPLVHPAGSGVVIPGDALIVYRTHYHAHYDHVNPTDTEPLPPVLEWPDNTSLFLRWEDEADVEQISLLLTFGNYDTEVVGGTGSPTAPFGIPPLRMGHEETMVTTVPGPSSQEYIVFAVQPEMGDAGQSVWVTAGDGATNTEECLTVVPRWDKGWEGSWQLPMTFSPSPSTAPVVRGGDRLRLTCRYSGVPMVVLTLAEESCRAMVGLLPVQ